MKKEEIFKLNICVHPLSKISKIIITDNKLHIYIKEAPEKNKANKAIIKMLKSIFKTQITITKGLASKRKQITISGKDKEDIKGILQKISISSMH